MTKKAGKPVKTAEAAEGGETPRKRSKLKLVFAGMLPVILGAGGYAAWAFYLGGSADAAHPPAEEALHEPDPVKVAAVPLDVAAETSFTHSYALSVIITNACGKTRVPALKAASEQEALIDGTLINQSWIAAARRTEILDERNCSYFVNEVLNADAKASRIAAALAAPPQDKKSSGH